MDDIIIRKGNKSDLPEVICLIKELALYEKAIDQVDVTIEQLEEDGFGKRQWYWFLVAELSNNIIGLSFYFIRYSTWKGKILFLEDFIVKEGYRGSGVGDRLFLATIDICREFNLNGMCWQVLDWNHNAIGFYKKYGAQISASWLNGNFTKDQISNFN